VVFGFVAISWFAVSLLLLTSTSKRATTKIIVFFGELLLPSPSNVAPRVRMR
jgi:hypothetical protein